MHQKSEVYSVSKLRATVPLLLTGYLGQVVDCMVPCSEALLALLAAGISAQLISEFATALKLAVRSNSVRDLLGSCILVIPRSVRPVP